MEFFHKKTSFPFMATRKVWYTLSAILMIGSFASFYLRGLNFAIDFTGGIAVEATFPKDVDRDAVHRADRGAAAAGVPEGARERRPAGAHHFARGRRPAGR